MRLHRQSFKSFLFLLTLIYLFCFQTTLGQESKEEQQDFSYSYEQIDLSYYNFIGPAIGFAGTGITFKDAGWMNRKEIASQFVSTNPFLTSHADDYIAFAPIGITYGLDLIGVKSKHDFWQRSALLAKSEFFGLGMMYLLKNLTNVERPDGSDRFSFPSGHTTQAFISAAFMHKELGHRHWIYPVIGYSIAGSVAWMRMAKERHWISDTFMGAGLGILTVELVYLTHKFKFFKGQRK